MNNRALAAIYARKSTDKTGVADEQKFVARRFDPRLDASRPSRQLAVQWAEEERKSLEDGIK